MLKKILAAASALCLAIPAAAVPVTNAEYDYEPGGDVNLDGELTMSDVLLLQRYLMGAKVYIDVDEADLNKDRHIDAFDLVAMRQRLIDNMENADIQEPMYHRVQINAEYSPKFIDEAAADQEFIMGQTEFALGFFKHTMEEGENVFISPTSAVYLLAMMANGAGGTTKAEMEQVIGSMPIEQLNAYLYSQRITLPQEEKCTVKMANSIWKNEDLPYTVKPEYMQKTANYYDTEVFSAPFDDDTLELINAWISAKTDKMIPRALDELDQDTFLMLINALTFDAKWQWKITNVYDDDTFTNADGTESAARGLYDRADSFIQSEHGRGMTKAYYGGRYSFIGIEPEAGMTPEEYIADITAQELNEMLSNRDTEVVTNFGMPAFKVDYAVSMNKLLADMGMGSAFDMNRADFSNLSDDPLYISYVLQKTHIELDNEGTKAAAVTIGGLAAGAMPQRIEYIDLSKPFVYMIVDNDTNLPIFMGTLNSLK